MKNLLILLLFVTSFAAHSQSLGTRLTMLDLLEIADAQDPIMVSKRMDYCGAVYQGEQKENSEIWAKFSFGETLIYKCTQGPFKGSVYMKMPNEQIFSNWLFIIKDYYQKAVEYDGCASFMHNVQFHSVTLKVCESDNKYVMMIDPKKL